MISMTMTRLGILRRPVSVCVGTGAKAASGADAVFGGGTGQRWFQQHRPRSAAAASIVRTVELIPPYLFDNTTSVSAAPERSP